MKKAVVLFLAFSLVGCERENQKICIDTEPLLVADTSPQKYGPTGLPLLSGGPSSEVAETQNAATLCIKEWGWKLARSQGSNEQLADAVMVQCEQQLQAVLKLSRLTFGESDPAQLEQAAANLAAWRHKAMARVIQGRAGHCKFRP